MATKKQETKPTPGPWSIDQYGAGQRIVAKGKRGFDDRPFRVADAHFSSTLANCASIPEMQANARLIAAAPDLLAALKDALALIEGDLTGAEWKRACHEFTQSARAAISRATQPAA